MTRRRGLCAECGEADDGRPIVESLFGDGWAHSDCLDLAIDEEGYGR